MAESVYRIPLLMPNDGLRAVNVYVIVTDEGVSLIDSGWAIPSSRAVLENGLRQLGKSLGDIRQFLVTHLHPDHYAQASVLRPEIGAQVLLGSGDRASLQQMLRTLAGQEEPPGRRERLQRAGASKLSDSLPPPPMRTESTLKQYQPPDAWLDGGQVIEAEWRRLAVVPTPGHTRGHVVFHDESDKFLFSGDHILPQITPSIGHEICGVDWPLRDYLDSLALIKQRPDAVLLPPHGPVWDSAHRRVDQLLDHHHCLLDEILRAVTAGAATAWEVASAVRWTYHDLPLEQMDVMNQSMAVNETVAHLNMRVLEGHLTVEAQEAIDVYQTRGPAARWDVTVPSMRQDKSESRSSHVIDRPLGGPAMTHGPVLKAMSGLMASMFVALMSSTVLVTALPTIIGRLRGSESQYTWVVTAALLTLTVSTPIFGKLADLVSPKLLVQLSIAIYILGSIVAGTAQTVTTIIAARAAQGTGSGSHGPGPDHHGETRQSPRTRSLLRLPRCCGRGLHRARPGHRRLDRGHARAGVEVVLLHRHTFRPRRDDRVATNAQAAGPAPTTSVQR